MKNETTKIIVHDNEVCVLESGGIAFMGSSHLSPAIVASISSGREESSISTDKTDTYGCPNCLNIAGVENTDRSLE